MPNPIPEATAYIQKLDAERRAAIEISQQKAEEAKLIAARQEGFRAAMEILGGAIPVNACEAQPEKSGYRRQRRDICDLILRELSFSGQAMTTTQIAKAIDYIPERTETALKRLENRGRLVRNENGRWVAVITTTVQPNGHEAGVGPLHKISTS
jgi:predicted transcriptional regulator